jgi:ornithine carbamoyltransferase
MQNLLAIDDVAADLRKIIDWAIEFKKDDEIAPEFKPLEGLTIASIYEKPSTRTRVSFEVGVQKLGGYPLTLLSKDIQIGRGETIADTAAVMSRYVDGMTYRCFSHSDCAELAQHADVPVINALSDLHHPCQAAADLMTIIERDEGLNRSRIAWVGDGNNVLHDLMLAAASLGVDINWATPEGFEPNEEIVRRAKVLAAESGARLEATTDPVEAVTDSNVIYTDAFLSMGEEEEQQKLDAFADFQVNEELLAHAKSDWVFMHCLPAHRGEEVSAGVLDSPNSIVFDQAENRMWAQMSLLTKLVAEEEWDFYAEMNGII